jgi:hypothetical protein
LSLISLINNIISILQEPSLFAEEAKVADMVCISSKSFCGGNDVRCEQLKGVRLQGQAEGYQLEKSRYPLGISFGVVCLNKNQTKTFDHLMMGYQKSHQCANDHP